MTTIVGLETGNGVLLGADTQATSGNRAIHRVGGKLFKISENCVMASAGSTRAMQILRHHLNLGNDFPRATTSPEGWLVGKLIPAMKSVFEEHGWLQTENGREEVGETWGLVGVRAELFALWQDFQVERAEDGFHSLGTGSGYALGVLHATRGQSVAQERLDLALGAAERFDTGTSGPFNFLAT